MTASKHALLSGFRRDCRPGISREAADLIRERDNIRTINPQDPVIEELNRNISKVIAENKRGIWLDKIKNAGHHTDLTKFWSFLRRLSGKCTHVPPNQPISFGTESYSNPNIIAE